ncbi:hypothetical protein [Sigmofec virus UA08Rod_3874]|uniref:Uncharacterized protein n=1 Tax=Sigmofec virus UA08Rod_3874 TaxID=2929391 RepID=A0A976N225_9VIRU|nr:hypothetical protein [Sigmofec virus UA08Rod_3874]
MRIADFVTRLTSTYGFVYSFNLDKASKVIVLVREMDNVIVHVHIFTESRNIYITHILRVPGLKDITERFVSVTKAYSYIKNKVFESDYGEDY